MIKSCLFLSTASMICSTTSSVLERGRILQNGYMLEKIVDDMAVGKATKYFICTELVKMIYNFNCVFFVSVLASICLKIRWFRSVLYWTNVRRFHSMKHSCVYVVWTNSGGKNSSFIVKLKFHVERLGKADSRKFANKRNLKNRCIRKNKKQFARSLTVFRQVMRTGHQNVEYLAA